MIDLEDLLHLARADLLVVIVSETVVLEMIRVLEANRILIRMLRMSIKKGGLTLLSERALVQKTVVEQAGHVEVRLVQHLVEMALDLRDVQVGGDGHRVCCPQMRKAP